MSILGSLTQISHHLLAKVQAMPSLLKEKTIDYEQYLYPTTNKSPEEQGLSSSKPTTKSKN